jgi:hypothetical protein
MPTYTVHTPPPKRGDTASAPERFVFIRDGFYFWAFWLAPLWLLVYRLWLVLFIYVLAYSAFAVSVALLGASAWMNFFAWLLLALLMGFEASTLRRWTLTRRGWKMLGFVVGDDRENAERRFFANWTNRAPPPAPAPESQHSMPGASRPTTGHDVIGLFPQSEA